MAIDKPIKFVDEDPASPVVETEEPEKKAGKRSKPKAQPKEEPAAQSGIPFDDGVVVRKNNADVPLSAIRNKTLEILRAQPKVTIMVPTLQGRHPPQFYDIGVNGVVYRVRRGVEVQVPKAIAEAYMHATAVSSDKTPPLRMP